MHEELIARYVVGRMPRSLALLVRLRLLASRRDRAYAAALHAYAARSLLHAHDPLVRHGDICAAALKSQPARNP